jgi:hypothetical protein
MRQNENHTHTLVYMLIFIFTSNVKNFSSFFSSSYFGALCACAPLPSRAFHMKVST